MKSCRAAPARGFALTYGKSHGRDGEEVVCCHQSSCATPARDITQTIARPRHRPHKNRAGKPKQLLQKIALRRHICRYDRLIATIALPATPPKSRDSYVTAAVSMAWKSQHPQLTMPRSCNNRSPRHSAAALETYDRAVPNTCSWYSS